MSAELDVAVVGAGMAGLALAHRLVRAGREVHVFESSGHVGGRMRTLRRDGHLVDTGAEMIGAHGYPATWRLLREVGMAEERVPPIGLGLSLWREGRAHPHVGDPRGLLTGAGLSPAGRRAAARLLVGLRLRSRAYDTDRPESTPARGRTLAEYARRFPREVHDYLLQPVAAAFFGWDTARAAAGPMLSQMLAVGPARTFHVYADGMDALARALAEPLAVSTGAPVVAVAPAAAGARLHFAGGTALTARTAVLCVPAPAAAALHDGAPEYVRAVEYRPVVKVCCLLDRPLEVDIGPSFGLLVPAAENPMLAGAILDDRKHPGAVPLGRGQVTLVAGPAATPRLLAATDAEVAGALIGQAERYLPGLGAACRDTVVTRFRHAHTMPTPAALALRPAFTRRPPGPIEYAGDWHVLRPSSEGAVRSAELVAERVLAAADRRPVVAGG